MAKATIQPYVGPRVLNVEHLEDVIVDVSAGGTRAMKREGEGFAEVAEELDKAIPAHAEAIGLSTEMAVRLRTKTEKINQVRAERIKAEKLAEVLSETEAKLEDEREADIGVVVTAARQAARRKDISLLVPFEKAIRYHGRAALLAAKTRKKNRKPSGKPTTTGAPTPTTTGAPAPITTGAPATTTTGAPATTTTSS